MKGMNVGILTELLTSYQEDSSRGVHLIIQKSFMLERYAKLFLRVQNEIHHQSSPFLTKTTQRAY